MTQPLPYSETRTLTATLAGQSVQVVTKPGFPGWEGVSAAQELLAAHAAPVEGSRVYLLGCGHGALAAALWRGQPTVALALSDANGVALAMAERTLSANGAAGAQVTWAIGVAPEQLGAFDLVLIETPQSRQLARRWLVEAHQLLREGGRLLVAGPNDQGIQSIIGDAAALFDGASQLAYGGRSRVAQATRSGAAAAPWADEPGIAPGSWYELEAAVAGEQLTLRSLPGIFSYNRLDEGTRLLLEHLPDVNGARVLDIGCGYGVIGVLAARRGAAAVDMVDVSTLAVAAARANIAEHHLRSANALVSDGLLAVARRRYDIALSNPPFHVGKGVDYDIGQVLVEQARDVLDADGRLALVANRFIRYDRVLRRFFMRVDTLAQTKSYHVLLASDS
jgi:16S rRNA (guanine1207-N2)-methyltransferase